MTSQSMVSMMVKTRKLGETAKQVEQRSAPFLPLTEFAGGAREDGRSLQCQEVPLGCGPRR